MAIHSSDEQFIESLIAIGYQGDAEEVLNALQYLHEVPERFYHAWDYHIRSGIAILKEYRLDVCTFHELVVAFGAHDCVCRLGETGNERASSDTSCKILKKGQVPLEVIQRHDGLIMATTHATDLTRAPRAQQLIADLDLVPIGATPKVFGENTTLLRKEAGGVDDATFSNNRQIFFQNLQKRSHIYYTPLFRAFYEEPAQLNLRIALAQ